MPPFKVGALAITLLTAFVARSYPIDGVDGVYRLKIAETAKAAAPEIFQDTVFFTYAAPHRLRFVGIAFAHENWRTIHHFARNEKGVLFFVYPIPDLPAVEYRLLVDGLWKPDPNNPERFRNSAGLVVSRLALPRIVRTALKSPVLNMATGSVDFSFRGRPSRQVYLAGSFNKWDAYLYPLREVAPGEYRIGLPLRPGTHYYYFLIDGIRIVDPNNPESAFDADYNEVSVFTFSR